MSQLGIVNEVKTALKTDEIQKNRNEMTSGKGWIYAEM